MSKINKNSMEALKKQIMVQSTEAIASNLKDFMSSLKEEQKQDAEDCIHGIAELTIKMALSVDEEEKEAIKATIGHYKNALENIEGAVAYKTYNRVIKIVGDVIAGIGIAVVAVLL